MNHYKAKREYWTKKIVIITIIFCFLVFVRFHVQILNNLGEFFFLTLHKNDLALVTLKINTNLIEHGILSKNSQTKKEAFYTYYLLGRVYFVENRLKESIVAYSISIKLKPEFKEAYYGRGLSYGFTSLLFYNDAEKDFRKYIEIEQDNFSKTSKRAYGAWAGYNDLAWILFLQGKFTEAESTARQGLEISNNNPWLQAMLGSILLEKGECKESQIYFDKAGYLLEVIPTSKFGEAYSGDSKDFWIEGQEQMKEMVSTNKALCPTFPQSTTTNILQ